MIKDGKITSYVGSVPMFSGAFSLGLLQRAGGVNATRCKTTRIDDDEVIVKDIYGKYQKIYYNPKLKQQEDETLYVYALNAEYSATPVAGKKYQILSNLSRDLGPSEVEVIYRYDYPDSYTSVFPAMKSNETLDKLVAIQPVATDKMAIKIGTYSLGGMVSVTSDLRAGDVGSFCTAYGISMTTEWFGVQISDQLHVIGFDDTFTCIGLALYYPSKVGNYWVYETIITGYGFFNTAGSNVSFIPLQWQTGVLQRPWLFFGFSSFKKESKIFIPRYVSSTYPYYTEIFRNYASNISYGGGDDVKPYVVADDDNIYMLYLTWIGGTIWFVFSSYSFATGLFSTPKPLVSMSNMGGAIAGVSIIKGLIYAFLWNYIAGKTELYVLNKSGGIVRKTTIADVQLMDCSIVNFRKVGG